jgi:hypothetical protein
MTSIAVLSLVAAIIVGLALIHETRLRRAAHSVARRLILALRYNSEAHDQARDGK